jgi:hypothetical protein
VIAKIQTLLSPGCSVVRKGHRTAAALALTDGPVLIESRCTLDRRLVGARSLVDVVRAAITGDGPKVLRLRSRVVATLHTRLSISDC